MEYKSLYSTYTLLISMATKQTDKKKLTNALKTSMDQNIDLMSEVETLQNKIKARINESTSLQDEITTLKDTNRELSIKINSLERSSIDNADEYAISRKIHNLFDNVDHILIKHRKTYDTFDELWDGLKYYLDESCVDTDSGWVMEHTLFHKHSVIKNKEQDIYIIEGGKGMDTIKNTTLLLEKRLW